MRRRWRLWLWFEAGAFGGEEAELNFCMKRNRRGRRTESDVIDVDGTVWRIVWRPMIEAGIPFRFEVQVEEGSSSDINSRRHTDKQQRRWMDGRRRTGIWRRVWRDKLIYLPDSCSIFISEVSFFLTALFLFPSACDDDDESVC